MQVIREAMLPLRLSWRRPTFIWLCCLAAQETRKRCNAGHNGKQTVVLTTNKHAFLLDFMARSGRFERPTLCSGGTRSIQLSYERAE